MADSIEEFEPLFDYRRVQPHNFVCIDDDDEASPELSPKRKKISKPIVVEDVKENADVIKIVDHEENEELDWLAPPPKSNAPKTVEEDSTIRELRLKKQELVSFAESAVDVLRAVEEAARRELGSSMQSSLEAVTGQPAKPPCERVKIVISIQDKDGLKHFRIYMDDKFERLFKMYADKVKLDIQNLVFWF